MDNLNNVGDWRLGKLPEEELLYISHSSMKPIFEDGKNNIISIKMYQHLELTIHSYITFSANHSLTKPD